MREIWELIVNNFIGCLIVFARVAGIFTFNPIFGRAVVPMRVRVSLSVVLTVVMLASMGGAVGYIPTGVPDFAFVILKEAAIGLIFGFIVNLTLTVIIYAGEIIDYQIGIMMAKAMDPMTGVTMPVFANL
ncbi:MAG: flagellar biosynthetic protein FliR, partial [Oscillospiraceae bacterium]|nr:flagellar biosynthetic protein FliR [Oscillospiraceae bacterium]